MNELKGDIVKDDKVNEKVNEKLDALINNAGEHKYIYNLMEGHDKLKNEIVNNTQDILINKKEIAVIEVKVGYIEKGIEKVSLGTEANNKLIAESLVEQAVLHTNITELKEETKKGKNLKWIATIILLFISMLVAYIAYINDDRIKYQDKFYEEKYNNESTNQSTNQSRRKR